MIRNMQPWQRPFYGWAVVAGMFVVLTLSSGLGFYNLGVYLRAISIESGLSIGAVSGPTGLFYFSGGVAGVAVARLLDRYSARRLMSVFVVAFGVALSLIGFVETIGATYVLYALLGLCLAGASVVPGTTVLTRWFINKRALALAVASAGLAFGGIVVTPLSASMISTYGLRTVMPFLGVTLVAVSVPILLFVVRDTPESVGLQPDGGSLDVETLRRHNTAGLTTREAFKTRFFLAMVAGYFLVQMSSIGGVAHHFNLVSVRLSEAEGAVAVSLLAAASLAGRMIGGWALSYIGLRSFLFLLVATQMAGLVVLALAGTMTGMLLGTALFGATLGNLFMMETLLIVEVFGVRDYAKIFSVEQLLVGVGVAIGPVIMGRLYDFTVSYTAPYFTAAAVTMCGFVVLWTAGPTKPLAADRAA